MTSRLAQQDSSQSTTQIAATPRQERVTIQEATRPPRSPPEISPTADDNTEPLLGSIAASHEFNVHRTQETDSPRKSPACKSDDRSRSRPLYQKSHRFTDYIHSHHEPRSDRCPDLTAIGDAHQKVFARSHADSGINKVQEPPADQPDCNTVDMKRVCRGFRPNGACLRRVT